MRNAIAQTDNSQTTIIYAYQAFDHHREISYSIPSLIILL